MQIIDELRNLTNDITKMVSILSPNIPAEYTAESVINVISHMGLRLPYHNAFHIAYAYDIFSKNWKPSMGALLPTYYVPVLAILFHDYVYYPEAKDNEEESCVALENFLGGFLDEGIKNTIYKECASLIMLTKNHLSVPDNAPEFVKLFVESDLAILGEDESIYKLYARDIRQEYCFVADRDYVVGRVSFLDKMNGYRFSILEHLNENLGRNLSNEISMLLTGDESILSKTIDKERK